MTQAMAELWKWLGTNWFSLLQMVSIVTGLVVVAKQQRDGNRQRIQNHIQRESDSVVKLYDIIEPRINNGYNISHSKPVRV
jgi:hypothetical protein